jgi:putative hydrolase of the HAD superfamily
MRSVDASCVVFDIDDTLYLERDYVRSGFRAVGEWARARLGIADFAERSWRLFEAGVRGSIFDDVLAESGVQPDRALVRALVDVYRTHEPAIEMLPDAADAVGRLRGHVALAALSDGPLESQRAKARALRVGDWAEVTVFTAELGAGFGKPDPRAFELVECRVACGPSGCVYVADNPAKDFAGPRGRGWRTVRVRREGALHAGIDSGSDVDLEVADLVGLEDGLTLPRS